MRYTAPSLLLACALLAPSATLAAALPANGGDPGKAYRACLDAIAKPDKAGIIALCFPEGDPWLEKTNLDYFTPETFALEVRQLRPEFRLADVVISGGKVTGDKADLQVSGQMTAPRLEPTGEIIEASRDPVKGTVSMIRSSSGWRPSESELERTFE
ncbi:MAG TPA: hypothetical protein VKK31_08490 [Thermoanaerobaculia bacterium]|nr:hypothetical protein [Thermoanaerobaculia bacterium]